MERLLQDEPKIRNENVRILHLEDTGADRELVRLLLKDAGIHGEITAIKTQADFENCLKEEDWDLILTDFTLPAFNGFEALAIASIACPHTPVIFVTGTLGEESAVESMKSGATDYVLKQRLDRLGMAVKRALRERDWGAGQL